MSYFSIVIKAQLRREHDPDSALRVIVKKVVDVFAGIDNGGVTSVVSENVVLEALAESTRDDEDLRQESTRVVLATRHPKFAYDAARRLYH